MAEPQAYLNGQFLPQSEARLTLNDAGFVFGATVTDLCRTFGHKPFRLAEHLARFRQSCGRACVPQPVPDEILGQVAGDLMARNAVFLRPEQDLALVLLATPGQIGYYLGQPGGPGDGPPTLGMHSFPIPFQRYAPFFERGARLVVAPTRAVAADCVDPRIKQRSRLHWWLAEQQARVVDPGASALLLDREGHVTETAAANLLIVREGTVLTPPRDAVLNGISLLTVEELCAELKIPFRTQPLTVADCLAAQEAMLSSTTFCLAGVSRFNGQPLPWPGPVYERLLGRWSQKVGLDIRRQIFPRP
jgi:branched-subunit amino acid aminotransferase/4-amino-4-deoxychorismate lyase